VLESPLPHSEALGTTLRLAIRPGADDPWSIVTDGEVKGVGADEDTRAIVESAAAAAAGETDLVNIFRTIEAAIKSQR
jgi:hypothetical protein